MMLLKALYKGRFVLLIILLAAAVGLWPHFRNALRVDNSLTAWFIQGDPALESYYQFQDYFGNDEVVILLYHPQDKLLSDAELTKLQLFSDSAGKLAGVARVIGAATVRLPGQSVFQASGRPLIPPGDNKARKLKENLAGQPLLREQFFTKDLSAARFIIRLQSSPDFEQQRAAILQKITRTAHYFFKDEETHFGGVGLIFNALNELSQQDFGRFLGIGYLLMFALIFIIYRSFWYLAYALGTIAFSTYFTLAIYGAAGLRLNLMTTLVPAIIILLCVMDVMHILNEGHKAKDNKPAAERARHILHRVWRPCLFTTLTTMAGFLTLLVSPIKILFTFGLFSALGILLGLFFAYLLGVIVLPLAPRPQSRFKLAGRLLRLQQKVVQAPRPWLLLSFMLVVMGLWGSTRIAVDTNTLEYLPHDHPVRQDSRAINRLWGPYMPLDFLVFPADSQNLQSPALLQGLHRLEQEGEQLAGMANGYGYHSFYVAALQQRYEDNWQRGWENASYLQAVGNRLEQTIPEISRSLSNEQAGVGRFQLSGEVFSAGTLEAKIDSIENLAKQHLSPQANLQVSGYLSLYASIINYVTQSQVNSFALAVVIIFALLWLFIGNFRLALISLLPNFFPVVVMLGFMGWWGIHLDTATACIASIVLSFSIDDTMHFIYHYRYGRKKGLSAAEAREQTISHVGRAILLTSLVLFTGYFLMIFGALKTVIYFGLLTAVSIAAALFSQLILFPILLKASDK